jgi:hypothetical protein
MSLWALMSLAGASPRRSPLPPDVFLGRFLLKQKPLINNAHTRGCHFLHGSSAIAFLPHFATSLHLSAASPYAGYASKSCNRVNTSTSCVSLVHHQTSVMVAAATFIIPLANTSTYPLIIKSAFPNQLQENADKQPPSSRCNSASAWLSNVRQKAGEGSSPRKRCPSCICQCMKRSRKKD